MDKKQVTHRRTAASLAGANAGLIVVIALLGDAAITDFKLGNIIPHARVWYYAIWAIILFVVVLYYEMTYQSELYEA